MKPLDNDKSLETSQQNTILSGDYHSYDSMIQDGYKPPSYYNIILGLLEPLYRFKVWQTSLFNTNYPQEMADRFGKRYHNQTNTLNPPVVWCHAVSLGETNTIAPMLQRLLEEGCHIWLTNTTYTGYNKTKELFAQAINEGQLQHSFVPVDRPKVVRQFLEHVKPDIALFIETELWANILYQLAQRQIPSVLVNGRLSQSSFLKYQKIQTVSQSMIKNLGLILVQDGDSAKRFRLLGADSLKIRVVGSLKWTAYSNLLQLSPNTDTNTTDNNQVVNLHHKTDNLKSEYSSNQPLTKSSHSTYAERAKQRRLKKRREKKAQLKIAKQQALNQSPNLLTRNNIKSEIYPCLFITQQNNEPSKKRHVWVAGSTHDSEETIALMAHQHLLQSSEAASNSLLIIVPRHPERFDIVAQLIEYSGLRYKRRSLNERPSHDTQVYLADSMGELPIWYDLADVAFVGGSFVNCGGHNPTESLAVGTPVIMGQYTQSCQLIVDELQKEGVLIQIISHHRLSGEHKKGKSLAKPIIHELSERLSTAIFELMNDPNHHQNLCKKSKYIVQQKQDVLERQLQVVIDVIKTKRI